MDEFCSKFHRASETVVYMRSLTQGGLGKVRQAELTLSLSLRSLGTNEFNKDSYQFVYGRTHIHV